MIQFFNLAVLAGFLAIGLFSSTASSQAANLTWKVKSKYPYKVSVVFYSRTRNHAWPGGTRVYILSDSRTHRYRIRCRYGEKICFGAWVFGNKSRYWGVGYKGKKGCRRCCYTCNGGVTRIQTLRR